MMTKKRVRSLRVPAFSTARPLVRHQTTLRAILPTIRATDLFLGHIRGNVQFDRIHGRGNTTLLGPDPRPLREGVVVRALDLEVHILGQLSKTIAEDAEVSSDIRAVSETEECVHTEEDITRTTIIMEFREDMNTVEAEVVPSLQREDILKSKEVITTQTMKRQWIRNIRKL